MPCLEDVLIKEKKQQEFRDSPTEVRKKWERLSDQEKNIVKLYTQGLLKREIADRLGVRHKTVDNHLQSVYKKLNIHSLAELKTMEDFIFG